MVCSNWTISTADNDWWASGRDYSHPKLLIIAVCGRLHVALPNQLEIHLN